MKKTNTFMAVAFLLLSSMAANKSHAQPYGKLKWQKCYGGTSWENFSSVIPTTDGGYLVAGRTFSNDEDISGNHGGYDAWIVKINSTGTIQWQKCYGGTKWDEFSSVISTTDGGYLAVGKTISNDGDVSGSHGQTDAWIVKINSTGTIQWQKCYGGTKIEEFSSIISTTDGGYLAVGRTTSNDGDVSGNHGQYDAWVVKINSTGTIQWQKCYGGTSTESFSSVIPTTDGKYLATGRTASYDGDVSGNHGEYDVWVVKINSTGTIQWQKCYGGNNAEYSSSVISTTDGGYLTVGRTASNDGDVFGNHGQYDAWAVKLDSIGIAQWQICLGGSDEEELSSIIPTTDGRYLAVGRTTSNDGDVSGNHGASDDAWVVKLSATTGTIEWQRCYGGTGTEYFSSVISTTDGEYLAAGSARSNDGDISGNHGLEDSWVVKFKEEYMMPRPPRFPPGPYYPFTVYPTIIDEEMNYITIQATDEEMDLPATITITQLTFPFKTLLTQSITSRSKSVDVSKLGTGTYIITITNSKGEVHKTKIVKQ